jgi:hypothetical protein
MKRLFKTIGLVVMIVGASLASAQGAVRQLNYAEPAEGSLGSGQEDSYTFTARAGDKPIIFASGKGGEIDPVVQLYSPSGPLVGEDDNGGGKLNALLEGIVLTEAGAYTVRITNQAEGRGGRYALVVNEASQMVMFNDKPNTAASEQGYLHYELSKPWDHTAITYQIVNTPESFSEEDVVQILRQAFQAWADYTLLTFTEVTGGSPDIVIEFDYIDGPQQVLGETCPPSSPCAGNVVLDTAENWVLAEPRYQDDISMLGVATHEFGHAVGLLHTDDPSALMYPQYSPYNLVPSPDDIAGVQRLYGAGGGEIVPTSPTTTEGESVQDTLSDNDYVHFWDFEVTAGEPVTISMEEVSGGLDPLLILIDANDNVLAYDDDGGGNFSAELRNITFPESGTYTVVATRYQQAQGYTTGEYRLTIHYGAVEEPAPQAPGAPSAPGDGSVQVGSVSAANATQYPSLDSVLNTSFVDTTSPQVQSASGSVQRNQSYVWDVTWCASDTAALELNLQAIDVSFAAAGRAVEPRIVTTYQDNASGMACQHYALLLSDWTGQRVALQATLSLSKPVFDGFMVRSPGEYIYNYDLTVG